MRVVPFRAGETLRWRLLPVIPGESGNSEAAGSCRESPGPPPSRG